MSLLGCLAITKGYIVACLLPLNYRKKVTLSTVAQWLRLQKEYNQSHPDRAAQAGFLSWRNEPEESWSVAHSHAEEMPVVCVHCGTSFAAEVWLIVDAEKRPELLTHVVEGSIHTVVCPNGHVAELDAPLLLFRPAARRRWSTARLPGRPARTPIGPWKRR